MDDAIRKQSLKLSEMKYMLERLVQVDSLDADSIKEYSRISGKGFLTTGPRIEAGNVVTHMGIIRNVTVSCSLCTIICNELFTDRHRCPDVLCIVVMLVGYVENWNSMSMDYEVLMLWFELSRSIVRLIRASFGITRLIRASFGITRLICVSFGITRLIYVSFGITRLVRVRRGTDRRGAIRMREGHMDASGFLYASADPSHPSPSSSSSKPFDRKPSTVAGSLFVRRSLRLLRRAITVRSLDLSRRLPIIVSLMHAASFHDLSARTQLEPCLSRGNPSHFFVSHPLESRKSCARVASLL
ncbi:ty3-gypsy retrotransposon protein [Cucumis melo var. makuwa]|uniref:Ty3-gypsy retrotransposon protein n=1 Tax=Cucumis melo var. makuwa TaxID=1194695 RepID=A0A5A7VGB2_CUCMM|nr:ty3-gypsy retrotransposon protein [Cucumis melo var. makuwa]TYK15229.1 ty3-gypsy retrotransposon protein [Cucumis melo var. makuwa]